MLEAKRENTTHPPIWAMGNLASGGKLRLGIPDTILFQDGAPQAWLFTSKDGMVLKKRSLRKSRIKDRFIRLSVSNPNNPQQRIANIRLTDGTIRSLGMEAFKDMMTKFPVTGPGIECMQCHVQGKGAAGTVYRNSYRVVNDKGLVVTGTRSFTTLTVEQAESPVSIWSERDVKVEKSNASSVNNALDAVTRSVVSFLETGREQPTRILELHCDYVVDAAGRIWLTWTGPTTVATAAAAQDLRLAKVRDEGPRGRGEFLGVEAALAMQREFGGPPAPTAETNRRPTRARSNALQKDGEMEASRPPRDDMTKEVGKAVELVELPRGAVGGGSGGIVDTLARAKPDKEGSATKLAGWETSLPSVTGDEPQRPEEALSTMTVGVRASEVEAWESKGRAPGDTWYPNSFACAGDFCAIRVMVSGWSSQHAILPSRRWEWTEETQGAVVGRRKTVAALPQQTSLTLADRNRRVNPKALVAESRSCLRAIPAALFVVTSRSTFPVCRRAFIWRCAHWFGFLSQDPREDAEDPRRRRGPDGSMSDAEISDSRFFSEVGPHKRLSLQKRDRITGFKRGGACP